MGLGWGFAMRFWARWSGECGGEMGGGEGGGDGTSRRAGEGRRKRRSGGQKRGMRMVGRLLLLLLRRISQEPNISIILRDPLQHNTAIPRSRLRHGPPPLLPSSRRSKNISRKRPGHHLTPHRPITSIPTLWRGRWGRRSDLSNGVWASGDWSWRGGEGMRVGRETRCGWEGLGVGRGRGTGGRGGRSWSRFRRRRG